jgi:heme-degrading monooxygenase HmoA
MRARVTTFDIKADRADDGARLFLAAKEHLRDRSGFIDAMLLLDRDTQKAMTIALWDSEQAMADSTDFVREQFANAAETMASPPQLHTYEVLEHRPGQGRRTARVSSGTMTANAIEAMRSSDDTSIIDAASRQPGYAGFLTVADNDSGHVMGVSFWESDEHMRASESAYYTEEMEASRQNWEGGWQQNNYEVISEP